MSLVEEKVDALKGIIDATEVKELERLKYRLSDAIREGCQVSGKATSWSDSEGNLCALSAAVVAAKARGYME
jgi:hypothetical protein